jgi:3-oxochol-4-en-24-oyl-CoA dehydrogenase
MGHRPAWFQVSETCSNYAVPIAITPDQLAMAASIRDWAKQAGPLAAVRCLEPGASAGPTTDLSDLAGLGVFSIAVPEDAGGAGGTLTDLAAALEQLAIALVPGPVLPTVLAGALFTAAGATAPLPALAAGQLTVAVALTAGSLTATRQAGGALRVTGRTGPVLGAGTTSHLLLGCATETGEAWFWIPAGHPGVTVTARDPVDFSRSLADVTLTGAPVPAGQVISGLGTQRVRDLAATVYAAEAAGVAAWCSGTAAGYARTRRQFGRPIGEFQAVKHLCATVACRAERAAALAWDAARTAGEAPGEHPLAAAAAAALALDDAVDNAKDCIQVLGGIGFTWEHDAHLYLRRALALRALLGGGASWRARVAELAAAGVRRRPRTGQPEPETSPYPGIGAWAGPAIEKFGTPEQQDRFLGPTRRAEITWCQLFSEPEAGSDLAGLRTRAARTAGGWRLTGQKVWTSLARQADWAIGLARTDPDVPRHQGLTYFLVDMHAPGIGIRPLREITGRTMFSEVFLDEVFVPDDCVLGAPGEGWRIAMSTLATERVAIGGGQDEAVQGLLAAAPPDYAERTGLHVATGMSVALLGERGAHPAIRKLIGTGHRQAVAETVLELLGPDGAADCEASYEFLLTRCLSIAGGTTQILLNQVAERVLGLPR